MHCKQTARIRGQGLRADLREEHGLGRFHLCDRNTRKTVADQCGLREDCQVAQAHEHRPRELDLCSSPSVCLPSLAQRAPLGCPPEAEGAVTAGGSSVAGGSLCRMVGVLPEDMRPLWASQGWGNCGPDIRQRLVFVYLSNTQLPVPNRSCMSHQPTPSTHACLQLPTSCTSITHLPQAWSHDCLMDHFILA